MMIFGLRSEATKDGRDLRKYKPFLETPYVGSVVHVLNNATNGYRDMVLNTSSYTFLVKFDGDLYKEVACFSHEYKTSDNIQPIECPGLGHQAQQRYR
jgi:hypothetical protein